MYALEFALAVVFITTPVDKLKTDMSLEAQAFLGPRIAALARQWELLDVRERDCLKKPTDFASDLKMLQRRYLLLLDAPKLSEIERFPDRVHLNIWINSNRRYWTSVQKRGDFTADQMATVLDETNRLYRIFDAIREARCEYFNIWYRRQELAKLRDLIDPRAFVAGQLPFHLPRVNLP